MLKFFCNKCQRQITDEGEAFNITVSLPKTENQRTSRGHLCPQCAKDTLNDLGMGMPVETKDRNPPGYRNERDVKMQKARNWAPGNNK